TIGGLVLTGGEMASAVSSVIEANALWLQGEIEPGIPRAVIIGGDFFGLHVVTKAGGFGDEEILVKCIAISHEKGLIP
ncbi:MAG: four-carbon acid sugar kinase family protein, partial [Candidatus Hydrogenedentes bacterium]|nr:four-carbon acid sugar kinase family protein [Candidatus Hydrogenedentota bacterium]